MKGQFSIIPVDGRAHGTILVPSQFHLEVIHETK